MSATEICGLARVAKNPARRVGSGSEEITLSVQSTAGGIYLAGRYGLGVLVSVGNMLVMTWWIGPHAYGLFVTGMGFVACLAAMARGGVDTYLIRNEDTPDGGCMRLRQRLCSWLRSCWRLRERGRSLF